MATTKKTKTKESPVTGFNNLVKDSTGVIRNKDRQGFFAARARKEQHQALKNANDVNTSQIEALTKQVQDLQNLVNTLQLLRAEPVVSSNTTTDTKTAPKK